MQILEHLDILTITSVVAGVTSIAAISISLYTAIERNARIYVMNSTKYESKAQQVIALTYDRLPQTVRDRFPRYQDVHPVCGACTVVFANSGDKSGYARITDITADPAAVAVSRYNYVTVPPNSIVGHSMLLHNIPTTAYDEHFDLTLYVAYQRGSTRQGRRWTIPKTFTATIKVSVSGSYH